MGKGARWSEGDLIQHELNQEAKKKGNFKLNMLIRNGDKPATKTNVFTAEIMEFLKGRDFEVWRNNTVGIFDQKIALEKLYKIVWALLKSKANNEGKIKSMIKSALQKSYRKSNDKKGVSDIVGYHKVLGTHIEVEVKVGKDTLSVYQIKHHEDLRKSKAISIVASKMNDVILPILKWESENLNK